MEIGITERGDPVWDYSWFKWVDFGKPAILISKSPLKLFYLLRDRKQKNVIVHCTITGWGSSVIEPNVPTVMESSAGVQSLIELIGKERLVIRIDPIIPTQEGFEKALRVFEKFKDKIERIRISFLDNYPHVKERFEKAGLKSLDYQFHAPSEIRTKFWQVLGRPEICGEPGMFCSGCVSKKDLEIFGINEETKEGGFQRGSCCCLGCKQELLSQKKQCQHKCIYCYWKDN